MSKAKLVSDSERLAAAWATRCNDMVADLRQLMQRWQGDRQPEQSITSAATSRCCNELAELLMSWKKGGTNGKR